MRISINHLSVEITRKCNLKCAHCCRGSAQNINIDYEYIDSLLDQVNHIHHLTFTGGEPSLNVPAMQYFIDECDRKSVKIDIVVIVTNGIYIKQDFIDLCIDIDRQLNRKVYVYVSDDKYHIIQKRYDDSLLSTLPFYQKHKPLVILSEGRGRYLKESVSYGAKASAFIYTTHFEDKSHYITLNAFGEIINGIDFSYENQKYHKMCNVKDLISFYTFLEIRQIMDNKFMEEDFERLSEMDKMYIWDREHDVWEEYQEWIEKQEKLPAKIVVKLPEELKQEEYDRERQRIDRKG